MITDIGSTNASSAFHRPLPIADGVALCAKNLPSRSPHHHPNRPRTIAIPHRRDAVRLFTDPFAPSRPTAARQIPIAP